MGTSPAMRAIEDSAMSIADLPNWFTGGTTPYMTLYHCMNHDLPWVMITVTLDLAVASGYVLIAWHWWQQQRDTPQSLAHRALGNMKNIFVFCGLCGYLFIPIKMVWPAWRLYDLFLAVLAVYTWRYAWSASGLKVIYKELTRSEELKHDLEEARAESRRKTLFLNALSHDLRTPLNGLLLQAQVAEMTLTGMDCQAEETKELSESLGFITANAQATAALLDGFLELGRLDWGGGGNHVTTFDLGDLLGRVVDGSRALAMQKGLDLDAGAPPGLLIRTDRAKLEGVLRNLTNNGLKFTQVGGVRLDVTASGPDVTIRVTDTGMGIEAEHMGRLFTEFFQGHNDERDRTKGYGLGLAIARRLAEQLGGDLAVASELGTGSRFSVTLPGVLARGEPVAPAASAHR